MTGRFVVKIVANVGLMIQNPSHWSSEVSSGGLPVYTFPFAVNVLKIIEMLILLFSVVLCVSAKERLHFFLSLSILFW